MFLWFYLVYTLLGLISSATSNPMRNAKAVLYLTKYGYIDKDAYEMPCLVEDKVLKTGIKSFQKFAGINETGEIDIETEEVMSYNRCGARDVNVINFNDDVELDTNIWKKKVISYNVIKYPRYLSKEVIDSDISAAFYVWTQHIDMKFIATVANADINISFVDDFNSTYGGFNSQDRVLGMSNPANLLGEIFMNNKIIWTSDLEKGTDFYQAFSHQIGHILGLNHNKDSSSVLYPFERSIDVTSALNLNNEDIIEIQKLYGRGKVKESILCETPSIDAMFMTANNKYMYIFKGMQYWKMTNGTLLTGYPKLISEKWQEINGPIDAAFQRDNGLTYFFKEHKYWRYQGTIMDERSPYITNQGFQNSPSTVKGVISTSSNLYMLGSNYIFHYRYNTDLPNEIEYVTNRRVNHHFDTFSKLPEKIILFYRYKHTILNMTYIQDSSGHSTYEGRYLTFNGENSKLFGCNEIQDDPVYDNLDDTDFQNEYD